MEDKADIGLVNAHAEGIGGHHNGRPVVDKILLVFPPLLVGEARVVAGDGKAVPYKVLADLLHIFPCKAVDDPALPGMILQVLPDRPIAVLGCLHCEKQVASVKARGYHRGLPKLQHIQDIIPHLPGSRGREGADHRPPGQAAHKLRDPQVAGPEVLPPLGDAVGLVHRHHGNFHAPRKVQKLRRHQPLRSHIDNGVAALPGKFQGLAVLTRRQGAV